MNTFCLKLKKANNVIFEDVKSQKFMCSFVNQNVVC